MKFDDVFYLVKFYYILKILIDDDLKFLYIYGFCGEVLVLFLFVSNLFILIKIEFEEVGMLYILECDGKIVVIKLKFIIIGIIVIAVNLFKNFFVRK